MYFFCFLSLQYKQCMTLWLYNVTPMLYVHIANMDHRKPAHRTFSESKK